MIDLTERECEFLFDHFVPYSYRHIDDIRQKLLIGCSDDYKKRVAENPAHYGEFKI